MYIRGMFTFIRSGFETLINTVFPAREQEKIVKSLTDAEILSLPHTYESNKNTSSLFSYKDSRVQALIWELKYHRNTTAIEIVGRLLAEHIIEELSEKAMFENMTSIVLVPIPITPKRLRERKFCQTDLLCREIMGYVSKEMESGITYEPDALKKVHETGKQSWSKSREDRLKNVQGAFSADEAVIRGKTIIVIDDVTTTGATLIEATRALTEAGAKSVTAFTVAH